MIQNDTFTPLQEKQWRTWRAGKDRGFSDEKIATKLGRTRVTISRLKEKAKHNGSYQQWLNNSVGWAMEGNRELYPTLVKSNPELVFVENNKVKLRAMVTYVHSETEIKQQREIGPLDVTKDEDKILCRAARILDKKLREKNKTVKIH